jgi:hypothetical protein
MVVDAYGNCDATVDDERKMPFVQILVLVAAVVVAKLDEIVNGYAKIVDAVR